jgi:hypothetical protein
MLRLYAQTMGQKSPALMADQARGASLIQSGGQLYQGAVYDNGAAYSYASRLGVYGGVPTTQLPTGSPYAGGPTYVSLHVDGQGAGAFLDGRFVPNLGTNSRAVAQSAYSGSAASNARANNAVLTLAPSVIVQ